LLDRRVEEARLFLFVSHFRIFSLALGIIEYVMKKVLFVTCVLLTALVALLGLPNRQASASSAVTAEDLISLVNGIRTSNGLPALKENSILDGTAQATAQTMADESAETHLGGVTERVAAAGYGGGQNVAATENFAYYLYGATLTWIQSVWADPEHMLPMTDSKYTDIGAGVATNPTTHRVYYVVHAAYVLGGTYTGGSTSTGNSGTSSSATEGTSQVMIQVITSTPNPDGSVIHVVQQGQTLWSIAKAYDIPNYSTIQALNNMGDNTNIYQGEKLLMPSVVPSVTPTETATIAPTRAPTRPLPTLSLSTATPVGNSTGDGVTVDHRMLGIIIIAICALGMGVVVFTSLRRR